MSRAARLASALGLAVVVGVLGLVAVAYIRSDDGSPGRGTLPEPGAAGALRTTTTTHPPNAPLPVIVPTPRQIAWLGPDVEVPDDVVVRAAASIDAPTRASVEDTLRSAGASEVATVDLASSSADDASSAVWLGTLDDPAIADALHRAGADPPAGLPAEGYVLAAHAGDSGSDDDDTPAIVLAGVDGDGAYYAAQTLRQLVNGRTIAGVSVVDQPSLAHRGVVEGFYGSPWAQDERLDQLAFYGAMKLNTYIYAPKGDPYHRDRWREPYPADQLAGLGKLVDAAVAHHVRFTFAVSPGVSICFSGDDDVAALEAKLSALYDLGVRDFAIAVDDIERRAWNCDGDRASYGALSSTTEARAQVDLLNRLQQDFVAGHEGTRPLVMVPTEYQGDDDSPYRSVVRQQLDPAISVMWTGNRVVPAEITAEQAAAAEQVFGRRPFVWDNYPVDDYPRTEGRLLLGPYARRAGDLDQHVVGVASNPMNQAAASKVALVGVADFTWNSRAYDPARAHRAAAGYLAGARDRGDKAAATVDALVAFFDVENLAPTSDRDASVVSEPQAPVLAGELDAFRTTWSGGDKAGAVAKLRIYAQRLARAPAQIRSGVADAGFVADCKPWLDALDLWGQALLATLDGLDARAAGDTAGAETHFQQAATLTAQAQAIHTIEGETLPQGTVHVADGVLDSFIANAPTLD